MSYMNILAIMDGSKKYDFINALISSLLSILLVFTVLLVIILITTLISKIINKVEIRNDKVEPVKNNVTNTNTIKIDTNDDDLMAAILVATIDYRNEIKQDVKVVSVKEIN